MNSIQTVLIDTINKLKCDKDKNFDVLSVPLLNLLHTSRGYPYHQLGNTDLESMPV
jgi:hypothetical protein